MYKYNPDRTGLSEVQILSLQPWRLYPKGRDLSVSFLHQNPPPKNWKIKHSTPIASIGSCFAREVKVWLKKNNFNFIETAQGIGAEAGSARYDRVYNTFSIRQEFERAFGDFNPHEKYWEFKDKGKLRLLDPYRRTIAWDNFQEMETELKEHALNVREAFSTAKVVIITVGQAEIWFHRESGYVYPLVPPTQIYHPSIHGFRLSTYSENLQNLEQIYELFSKNNPCGRIILTLSPVPLRATFRTMNSIIANTSQKSMLRAVIDEFCQIHPENVIYFPAYEILTVVDKYQFEDDNRHITSKGIESVMSLFTAWFLD